MTTGSATIAGRRAVTLRMLRVALRAPNPLALIRGIAFPEPPPPTTPIPQLSLWVVDADGLPPRPWRLAPDATVECRTLKCTLAACRCVARQMASDVQRTKDTWRGEASAYPHCVTDRCAQGRGVRAALDPSAGVTWRGAGPGKRFEASRRDVEAVARARARQRAEGLLDEAPTIDGPIGPGEGNDA